MKKILFLLPVALLFSCEEWLDVNPQSQVKEGELFRDESGFRNALFGVYNLVGNQSLYGQNLTMGFADVLAQYYYVPQATHGYYYVTKYDYEHATAKAFIAATWTAAYNAIANANNLLAHVDEKGEAFFSDPRYYGILKGEAKALRALLHFDLLRLMAPACTVAPDAAAIPFVDKVSLTPFPPLTVAGVVDRCLAELEEAAALLYEVDPISPYFETYTEPDLSRPLPDEAVSNAGFFLVRKERLNYLAVKGLMARVYLYKGDRENARRLAEECLLPARVAAGENLFEVYNASTVSMANALFPNSGTINLASSLVMPKDRKNEIYEMGLYLSEDARIRYYFLDAAQGDESQIMAKYRSFDQYHSPAVPVLSVAEVALILAEATDDVTLKFSLLNSSRHLFGLDAHDLLPDEAAFENELFKEYRKRFVGEGVLFYFMKRKNYRSIPYSNTTVEIDRVYSMLQHLPSTEYEYGLIKN
jgi:hypothetical protein